MTSSIFLNRLRSTSALVVVGGLASVGALPLTAVAHAQSVPTEELAQDADEPGDDTIVVTGSRLQRDPNEAAPSPVAVVTAEEIQQSGIVDATEALRDIPALSQSGTVSDSLQNGEGGVGQATLNLRGLGAERTLVVVDGKRHVSGVSGTQIVDVATIPPALIERVEVLTGGASAIYGADAVTGVVNYVLKDDFEGFEVLAQSGVSEYGDGFTGTINATLGANFGGGRGNITLSGGYARIDEIQQGARLYSRDNALSNTGTTYPNPLLRFQQGDINATGTPNFFGYYSTANGRYPYGFVIPQPGTAAYNAIFTGGRTPTPAEQALIDQAAGAPALAFQPFPAFAISSNSGQIYRADFAFFDADINSNGVNDCEESYIGFVPFGGGGCYVSTPEGGVRIFQDGIIANNTNQFGGDGSPESLSDASLIPQQDRYSANLRATYEFSSAVEAFVDAKYVRTETASQDPYNTFYDLLYIFPDNPYIPAAIQADADAAGGLRVSRDFTDLGDGFSYGDRDTYRIVGGLRGDLGSNLSYEIFGNYGRTDSATTTQNSVLYDRLFAALDAVDEGEFLTGTANGNIVCRSDLDPTALHPGSEFFPVIEPGFFTFNPGDGQCRPISIFNGENSVSAEGVAFITTPTTNNARIEQLVFGASLVGDTGSFFNMPGGAVQFAVGAEYREEKSRFEFDPIQLGILQVTTPFGNAGDFIGDISGNQSLDFDAQTQVFNTGGRYDVYELFGELRIPILADRPFFEELSVEGAARYSDYSTIGGTFTWNVNGIWAPVEDIKFRGTYARAVRAPNISELFSPQQGTVFRPADPCDAAQIASLTAADPAAGARVQANCVADGLPVGFTDPLTARFSGTTGGNPDLQEETATTYTFGTVIAPRFVPGLVLSADYYNIKVEDAISAVSAQDIVDSCYNATEFPNQFCDSFDRNRDPNSPTFLGFNFLRQSQLNFGRIETSGIDGQISYRTSFGDWDVGLRGNLSWVDELNLFFDPTDLTVVNTELGEIQRPEWSGSASINVGNGPFSLGYRLQWLDQMTIAGVEIETADVRAGPAGFTDDTFIHDISFGIEASDEFELFGGVNNVTDVEPFRNALAYPVNPYGRYYYVGVRIRGNLGF